MIRVVEPVYEFDKFRLDANERLFMHGDDAVPLSPKTFDILLLLVRQRGHLVTKEDLLSEIWKESYVEEVNLAVHVSTLRKCLGQEKNGTTFIETVPKKGYRFVADVLECPADVVVAQRLRISATTEEIESTGTAVDMPELPLSSNPRLHRSHRLILASIALCLALSGIAYVSIRYRLSVSPPDFSQYSLQRLTSGEKTGYVVIAPNGEFIIFGEKAERGWSFKMRRLGDDTAVTVVPEFETACWGVTISHDNNYFYYVLADLPPTRQDQGTLYRVSVLGGPSRKVLEGINSAPTLSPDDRRVGFMRYPRPDVAELLTANSVDGSNEQLVATSENQAQIWNPEWSPDGNFFTGFTKEERADGNYYSLVNVPANGGEIKPLTVPSKQYIWWHAWLADQTGLVAIQTDAITSLRQVIFVSYPDGAISKVTNDMNHYAGVSVSSDASKIVIGQSWRDSNLVVSSVRDPRQTTDISIHACCPDESTWTPDGHLIYDAFEAGKRALWRISQNGDEEKLSAGFQDWSPTASPDGRYLVFLSTRSGRKQIWRSDQTGRGDLQLTHEENDIDSPQISPDGSNVYFGEYSDGKWKIASIPIDGGGSKVVVDERTELWAISPDGRQIAYTFWDAAAGRGRVAVRSIDDRTPISLLDITPDQVLNWTADGRSLIYQDAVTRNDVSSALWKVSIDGHSGPTPITDLGIRYFNISRSVDGSQMAFVRGREMDGSAILERAPR
jgi:DNA-binding winged helix-turn-helix (wHTH) protein/Tol biopolymer transport system component